MPNSTFTNAKKEIVSLQTTIASGASLSDALQLKDFALVGIIMPSTWTSASITLQASIDGTTFFNVFKAAGGEYTITAAASEYILVPTADVPDVKYIKFRSGTSGTPVTQGQDTILTILAREL